MMLPRKSKKLKADFGDGLSTVNQNLQATYTKVTTQVDGLVGKIDLFETSQNAQNLMVRKKIAALVQKSNENYSTSKRARGKLRDAINENKQIAHRQIEDLRKEMNGKLGGLRTKIQNHKKRMADDLADSTKNVYQKMKIVKDAAELASDNLEDQTKLASTDAAVELGKAKQDWEAQMTTFANRIAADKKQNDEEADAITGAINQVNKDAEADRRKIKDNLITYDNALTADIAAAVKKGQAAAVQMQLRINNARTKTFKKLELNLAEELDKAADQVFKTLTESRQKTADNYLSLKAYAVAAYAQVTAYRANNKGSCLSSIGDLLDTLGSQGAVRAKPSDGIGGGGDKIHTPFSGEKIDLPNAVAALNGLVDEYTKNVVAVSNRSPFGLGKYLLKRLEHAMTTKGVLQVDKVSGESGNFVFMNGHSVGLSSKLQDFERLAVKMKDYEQTLAELTAALPASKKTIHVAPPSYDGTR